MTNTKHIELNKNLRKFKFIAICTANLIIKIYIKVFVNYIDTKKFF